MRVAAYVHFSVPKKNAGSEVMLHRMLVELVRRGHQVRCFVTDNPDPSDDLYLVDGVEVQELSLDQSHTAMTRWKPDVLVTHHQRAQSTPHVARLIRRPWVLLIHNDHSSWKQMVRTWNPALTVYNTHWIQEKFGQILDRRSMVVHPPVEPHRHRTTSGDMVTLINPIPRKGSDVFYALAERMPDTKFLAVEGAYGPQDIRDLPNVELVRHTTRMREDVWSRTKVLLIPSVQETYGMVGMEAIASGIPCIATPTPGLIESLGYAGTFVPRDDVDMWYHHAHILTTDQHAYNVASTNSLSRSDEMDTTDIDMQRWALAIESLA